MLSGEAGRSPRNLSRSGSCVAASLRPRFASHRLRHPPPARLGPARRGWTPRSSAQRPADRPGPRARSQVRGAGMLGARPRGAEVEAGGRSLGEEPVGVPAVSPFPASRPPSSSPGDPLCASPFRASERIGPGQSWVGGGDARRWAPVRGSCGALAVPGKLGDPMGEISGFPAGRCVPGGSRGAAFRCAQILLDQLSARTHGRCHGCERVQGLWSCRTVGWDAGSLGAIRVQMSLCSSRGCALPFPQAHPAFCTASSPVTPHEFCRLAKDQVECAFVGPGRGALGPGAWEPPAWPPIESGSLSARGPGPALGAESGTPTETPSRLCSASPQCACALGGRRRHEQKQTEPSLFGAANTMAGGQAGCWRRTGRPKSPGSLKGLI